ncbi:unnamed protein product [Mytilus coruscus]|uniref:Uncharacterized protein n=1 Tax=Mytilus coruscus TaxID=42192 RepID=A0A6J8C2A9_MYTCO|nr:unnamed protein product [Mytilus coruscus]
MKYGRVCHKSEMLKNLKDKCCSDLSQSSRQRLPHMDNEQLMMRRQVVRPYLAVPCTPKPHVSLSGEALDKHLYSFKSTGKRNYEAYTSNLASSDTYKGAELESVFILKEKILQQVNNLVDVMPDNDCQQTLRAKLGTLKNNVKKVELIELYYEMCSELEDQLADETVPEIETDNIDTV